MDWRPVEYCDIFISCLDSHSDGTHSLQRIHWQASDEMQNIFPQICSDQETNSSILYLGWLEGEYILGHF